MRSRSTYAVTLTVEVPAGLVRWVSARLGVSNAAALDVVRRSLRLHTFLGGTKVAELARLSDEPLVELVQAWARAPREGDRWFDCGLGRAKRMVGGRVIDDEEDSHAGE